jgi:hypothetical protein
MALQTFAPLIDWSMILALGVAGYLIGGYFRNR